ncbi:MAG: hypothetical protein Q7J42_10335 [Sulfuritalea sp.]|nr:hypothetical protein [Sulfuritalea sp.]
MKPLHALILATGVLASPALFAHGDNPNASGPNGGQLRQAGAYDYELVMVKDSQDMKENPVIVYVTVHDKDKVPTAGATGSATILAGKLKAMSTLKPDGDNRMKGFAKYSSAADMKVVVSITLNGKAAEQTRFAPLTKSAQ